MEAEHFEFIEGEYNNGDSNFPELDDTDMAVDVSTFFNLYLKKYTGKSTFRRFSNAFLKDCKKYSCKS